MSGRATSSCVRVTLGDLWQALMAQDGVNRVLFEAQARASTPAMSHQPRALMKSELSLFRPDLAAPRAEAVDGGAGEIDAPLRSRARIYIKRGS